MTRQYREDLLCCVGADPEQRMPVAETTCGNNRVTVALASHIISTEIPMPAPRNFSGKISASMSHTSGPRVPCIEKTKSTTKTRMLQ